MAVAVAANPGAETKHRRQLPLLFGVNFFKVGGDQAVELGYHLKQAAFDHLESLAHFVDHFGPLGAD